MVKIDIRKRHVYFLVALFALLLVAGIVFFGENIPPREFSEEISSEDAVYLEGVSLSQTGCSGPVSGGYCWTAGSSGQNCNSACAGIGMFCPSSVTWNDNPSCSICRNFFSGADCNVAWGSPYSGFPKYYPPLGCFYRPSWYSVSCSQTSGGMNRICACDSCTDSDGDGQDGIDSFCPYPKGSDCDDTNPDVYHGAPEVCNGIDDNCNGAIDESGCSDGVGCTLDVCIYVSGEYGCTHTLDHLACRDTFFCNGQERCDITDGCESGSNPCNDHIGCTQNLCDEDTDSCSYVLRDDWCPPGQICDAALDCISPGESTCRDGTIEGSEECDCEADGSDCAFTGHGDGIGECSAYDSSLFTGGDLICGGDCMIDTSGCEEVASSSCRNGSIDAGEECDCEADGSDCAFGIYGDGVNNCSDYDSSLFTGGDLTCEEDCTIDTGGCIDITGPTGCPDGVNFVYQRSGQENYIKLCWDINDYSGGDHDGDWNIDTEYLCNVCSVEHGVPWSSSSYEFCYWEEGAGECLDAVRSGPLCTMRPLQETSCELGQTKATIEVELDGAGCDECGPGSTNCIISMDVPCVQVVELPLFGFWNAIVCVIIFVIAYFLLSKMDAISPSL